MAPFKVISVATFWFPASEPCTLPAAAELVLRKVDMEKATAQKWVSQEREDSGVQGL